MTHPIDVSGLHSFGRVDPTRLAAARDATAASGERTALVNLQWDNDEVGTMQPVAEIVAMCRERGVLVHIDAAAAAGAAGGKGGGAREATPPAAVWCRPRRSSG